MSDAYNFLPSFFSEDPRTGALTYDQLQARRKIAMALATRNRPYPKTIGEGLTAFGEGLGEGINLNRLQRAEATQSATDAEGQRRLRGDAPTTVPGSTSLDTADPINALALASPEEVEKAPPEVKLASMPIEEWKQRIRRNESGGQPDPYRTIGQPNRRGDYPYGAYQVMGENIPKWTKAYLGKELTPQEFLDSPEAQERVADGQGGKYLAKYGPIGAGEAWFAGERGRVEGRSTRKDTLGTHIDEYVRRFNLPLVNRDQLAASAANAPAAPAAPATAFAAEEAAPPVEGAAPPVQLASLGGMPTPNTAPDPAARDMVAQALAAQQQPAPPPQQVAQVGGGALPAVPPTMPVVPPQNIPKAPATPAQPTDPGPEPKLRDFIEGDPGLKRQMDTAREVARDPKYRDDLRAQAQKQYEELERRANDAFKNKWTVWHEDSKKKKEFELGADERNVKTEQLRGQAYDEAEKRRLTHRFGGIEPPKFFDNLKTEQNSAEVASRMMSDNQLIIRAVKDGVIMGTGAGWRLNVTKLAAWAAQNGYASELAANTEISRALAGSRIREAMSQINPSGPASNVDLLISKQLSGTDPSMEPKSFMQLLHKSNGYNAKMLNDFEDKRDYYLSGERAERQFQINAGPTAPKPYVDALLQNRDDKAARAAYDDRFGEGSAALEIERFKRRTRRGQ